MAVQVRNFKDSFYLVLVGMVIGSGMIIPGVSGGVMAVVFGIYEQIIDVVARPWRNLWANLKFTVPLVLGALVSVFVLSNVLSYLLTYYPVLVKYLFIGLLAGSIPALVKVANERGFNRHYLGTFLVGLLLMLIPLIVAAKVQTLTDASTVTGLSGWQSVLSGILLAAGTVVPGVSSSFLLIFTGTYEVLLNAVADLQILVLLPTGISAVISAFLISRVTSYLLRRFYGWTYYGLLGVVAGSIIVVFPGLPRGFWEGLLALMLLAFGILAAWGLSKADKN
ncbi:MAG: DUF368 domain-containing protein [Firmicutes bacterium]|mgnify:FL=1|jgi:putative membrane protein|nr:DUF368 domain-containing protein [Bacillota bacterium]NLL89121.1 DUF368 domain-containing protein [Bacillota bacterium]